MLDKLFKFNRFIVISGLFFVVNIFSNLPAVAQQSDELESSTLSHNDTISNNGLELIELTNQADALTSNIEFPDLQATSWILVNSDTRSILLQHNADMIIAPASMTKVMTAYIVFDFLKMNKINENDLVLVSEKAWRVGGSKMFIEVNKEVSLIDLLRGLIIQSGNDSAIALAEYIAGSEAAFASLMNQYAKGLGMNNSNFKNASGWPDEDHYTTSKDLSILSLSLIENFPKYYEIYSERSFKYNNIEQYNRNGLLRLDRRVDGVKTGHTEEAGYCLIGSSFEENDRFIAVVTGADSVKARESAVHSLLKFAHDNYKNEIILSSTDLNNSQRVLEGESEYVKLKLLRDASILLPSQLNSNNLSVDYSLPKYTVAPITENQALGELVVTYNNQQLNSYKLYANDDVQSSGFFSRMIDKIKAFFI